MVKAKRKACRVCHHQVITKSFRVSSEQGTDLASGLANQKISRTSSKMKCRAVTQHPGHSAFRVEYTTHAHLSGQTLSSSRGAVPEESVMECAYFHSAGACLFHTMIRIAQLSVRKCRGHALGKVRAAQPFTSHWVHWGCDDERAPECIGHDQSKQYGTQQSGQNLLICVNTPHYRQRKRKTKDIQQK
jgi:hypothetical protein